MPIEEADTIRNSQVVSEHRKIKIGEKGAGERSAPKRYKAPVVSMPRKGKGGEKFDVDELTMNSIRLEQGLAQSAINPATGKVVAGKEGADILGVPVRLFTDNIEEAMFVYRAAYNSYGRALCKSNLGDAKAKRWFSREDPGEANGKKVGKIYILNQPTELDCNKKCPLWPKPGEKTECSWHLILTVQLEHSRVFPQPTRFRSSGWTVINHLRGSLNKIAAVTGGVLANIPLLLVEVEIESRTAAGEKRTHPVMEFTWRGGTIDALRELAVAELNSRLRLKAAKEGKHVGDPTLTALKPNELTAGAMSTPAALEEAAGASDMGDPEDFVDLDDAEVVASPTAKPDNGAGSEHVDIEADALLAEVEALKTKTGVSARAYDAMVDKHAGVMDRVRDELKTLAGTAPAAVVTPATADAADDDWGPGDDSNEPSETVAEAQANAKAEAQAKADEKKAQAQAPEPEKEKATTSADFDDFTVFDDE